MDLFDAIQKRQSIRAFQPQAVEPEKLNLVLQAVQRAPSAGNLQAYAVHIVRDQKVKAALAAAALDQQFMAQAPVVLVFVSEPELCAKYGERGRTLYSVQDPTIATAYAQLAATAQGLSSCWVGAFDDVQVGRILGLSAGERPVSMLPIGYAAEAPPKTSRREIKNLVIGE